MGRAARTAAAADDRGEAGATRSTSWPMQSLRGSPQQPARPRSTAHSRSSTSSCATGSLPTSIGTASSSGPGRCSSTRRPLTCGRARRRRDARVDQRPDRAYSGDPVPRGPRRPAARPAHRSGCRPSRRLSRPRGTPRRTSPKRPLRHSARTVNDHRQTFSPRCPFRLLELGFGVLAAACGAGVVKEGSGREASDARKGRTGRFCRSLHPLGSGFLPVTAL